MTRIIFIATFLFLLAAGWIGREYLLPDPILPQSVSWVTPEQAGLVWQECELPLLVPASASPSPQESDACFGRSAPVIVDDEKVSSGRYLDHAHVRMTAGQDIYEARADDRVLLTVYSLYKNNRQVKALIGLGDTMWLHMFLSKINDRVAWGIANGSPATIVYDGKDLRNLYGLDKAHAAYGLAGKLIFVGEKGNKYFVMYDGQKVGPEYDRIVIAYCCETMLYSVRSGQGRYQFRGTRAGKDWIVEIRSAQISADEQAHAR